jgi:metal-sulfur cluster biosynthetic enzyme
MKKFSEKQILNKISKVLDPELNISIVDLGLIYQIKIIKNKIKVVMTLTTVGCPLFSLIESQIKDKISELGVKEKDISLELVFDPLWTMEKMSKKGKEMLGI